MSDQQQFQEAGAGPPRPRRHQMETCHVPHAPAVLGISALRTGELRMRLDEERDALLTIRRGERSWPDVNAWRLRLHKEFDETRYLSCGRSCRGPRRMRKFYVWRANAAASSSQELFGRRRGDATHSSPGESQSLLTSYPTSYLGGQDGGGRRARSDAPYRRYFAVQ